MNNHQLQEASSPLRVQLSIFIFYSLLFSLLILEGWALPFGRLISFHLLLFAPFILFGVDSITKRKVDIPLSITIWISLFILTIFTFSLFSANIQMAFEHRFFIVSVFLVGLFAYNHQKEIKKYFPFFVVASTISTLLFTLFVRFFLSSDSSFYISPHGYQFVGKTGAVGHDQLGAFILVPLVIIFTSTLFFPRVWKIITTIFLSILLLLSSLRASYLSFASVLLFSFFITKAHYNSKVKMMSIALLLAILCSLFLLTNFGVQIPIFSKINATLLESNELLHRKSSIPLRIEFYNQAIAALHENPFLGVGSDNFEYASMRFTKTMSIVTETSHNIFLDKAVENGVVASFFFIVVIFLLFKNSAYVINSNNTLDKTLFSLSIALVVLFQFSHYHKMYFLFTLFIVILSLLYKERKVFQNSTTILIVSSIVAVINIAIILARISLANGNAELALKLYPIYTAAHDYSIMSSYNLKDYDQVRTKIEFYSRLYSKNPISLAFIADTYGLLSDNTQALYYYDRALHYFPQKIEYLIKRYDFDKNINGEIAAKQFVSHHIDTFNVIKNDISLWSWNTASLKSWCEEKQIECKDN